MAERSVFARVLFVFMVTLFFSVPALAKEGIDAEGGKRLQAVFEEMLSQYEDAARSNGATLVREGGILVESGESYYAVTLPHLTLKAEDGSHTDIGMISINALPGDTPEQWKMTMALPMPIVSYDSANKPVLTIKAGTQSFAGIWHEAIKNFTKLDAHYGNFNIRLNQEMATISVPDMRLTTDMKQGENGLWTGSGVLTASGLNMFLEHDGTSFGVKEIKMISSVKDYSAQVMQDYEEKLAALAESDEGGEVSVSGEHALALYNLFFDFMQNAWEGYDFSASFDGLALKVPERKEQPGIQLALDKGEFGFGMNGFRTGSVGMGLAFKYGGLRFAPVNPVYAPILPDHAGLDFHIDKLPYKEMVDLGRTSLQGVTEAPQAGALVGMNAVMVLPQLLTKAQTTLTLKDSSIGNGKYDILSNAVMTANLNAKSGMTGTSKTQIYGLDFLIEALSAVAASPETPEEKMADLQQALASLTILKMVGQMDKDSKGRDVRSYVLDLNEQGQTLLNGTDLQTLIQSIQGAAQK